MNAPIDTLDFAKSFEASREDVVTLTVLKAELAELKLDLVKGIARVNVPVSGRLWSTVTIIAGVATAISATIGAGVALPLHAKGL